MKSPNEVLIITFIFLCVTGMSTAPEVIIAQHCGMRVLGVSLITNKCIVDYESTEKANHEDVLETGRIRGKDLQNLIVTMLREMPIARVPNRAGANATLCK